MIIRVGLVGLGAMGLPMGKRVLGAGFPLAVVPHLNDAPARVLEGMGATIATDFVALAEACDIVITIVPDAPQVNEVLFAERGLATAGRPGLLHIDMSTIAPSSSRDIHAGLSAAGIQSLDAPVSGGPTRAADGTLTIMVGGDKDAFERARPVLDVLGKQIVHVGGPGAGQMVKISNQLMISVIMLANAEALTLGVKAGIPLETLVEVIGTSSGANYLMQNWLPRTLFSGDLGSGFALDLLIKDLRAALQSASELGVPSFAGTLAEQLFSLVRTDVGGRLDYSVVAKLYEDAAGVELRSS